MVIRPGKDSTYIPDQEERASKERLTDPYDKGHFIYDPLTNQYTCPAGQILKYKMTVNSNTRKQHYKVFEGICCNECSVKSNCTRATKRQIHQELREPLRDAMRERLNSREGKKMYQKRMNTVEHAWGNIKFNNRVTMFHLRGIKKSECGISVTCNWS